MRFGRSLVLLVVVVVLAAAVGSGVTYLLVRHDSNAHKAARPPIALVGVLRDTAGTPVADAWVQLTVIDETISKVGATVPIHQLAGVQTDAAGRFTIRQSQSVPIIRKLAAANGNWVNFNVNISSEEAFMPWGIPRKINNQSWLAEDNPDVPAAVKVERLTFKSLGS